MNETAKQLLQKLPVYMVYSEPTIYCGYQDCPDLSDLWQDVETVGDFLMNVKNHIDEVHPEFWTTV